MSEGRRDRLWRAYWDGRESTTLKTYGSAYRGLKRICEMEDLSLFHMNAEARCEVMMVLEEQGKSEGMLRLTMAVISMIREVTGETGEESKMEAKVRKSTVKKMNLKKKKKRKLPANMTDIQKLLGKVLETNVEMLDRMVAMVFILSYLGCRRFSDINRLRLSDISFGSKEITFFMAKSKTDVLAVGREFTVANGSMGEFTVEQVLGKYINVMGLQSRDFLFPTVKGKLVDKRKSLAYSSAHKGLELLKKELGLDPRITLHSPRVGSATEGARLGVRRSVLKEAGQWRSDAVDGYIQEERAGGVLSRALLADWN